MSLVHAADAAYPPALQLLPLDCRVVLGYAGELHCTPHVWTRAEADAYRDAGKEWWPIWVPPQGDLARQSWVDAVQGAVAACQALGVRKTDPVFVDIEAGSWQLNAAGAGRFLWGWKAGMKKAGYLRPLGYVPKAAGLDWVADWTGVRPTSLPAGVVGVQYRNAVAAGAYDLSVFDAVATGLEAAGPKPSTETEGQIDMFIAHDPSTQRKYLFTEPRNLTWIPDETPTATNLEAKLGPAIDLSPAFLLQCDGYKTP